MKPVKLKSLQAGICVLCAAATSQIPAAFAGSEFSGGALTGPLLTLFESGTCLFILALLLTFVYQRIAAAIGLAASVLCVPLYLYFLFPASFRKVFAGEYSVPLYPSLVWDKWATIGVLALAVAVYVCLRALIIKETKLEEQHSR